jgi:4-carboxymuconolactone decarboxylase
MGETDDKIAKGRALAAKLFAGAPPTGVKMPAKMQAYTMGHVFGEVWQGEELSLQERSLITCCALVAMNRTAEQKLHFVGARNLGLPREKIEAMITHVAHYAGWPCAVSAFEVLGQVWPDEPSA